MNAPCSLKSVKEWQADVDNYDVGFQPAGFLNELSTIAHDPYDGISQLQEASESLGKDRVVIRN
jgi:hypothetical protein